MVMPNVFILLDISMRNKRGLNISLEAVDQNISAFDTMPYFDDVIFNI